MRLGSKMPVGAEETSLLRISTDLSPTSVYGLIVVYHKCCLQFSFFAVIDCGPISSDVF